MGFPLSPIIADIVLQDIEKAAIDHLSIMLSFYIRYVDDILLATPQENLDNILNIFNSFHERLQFIMEVNNDGHISFLDVSLMIKDKKIIFALYKKPTNSGRYLSFHPMIYKNGVICGLFDKIIFLSQPTIS